MLLSSNSVIVITRSNIVQASTISGFWFIQEINGMLIPQLPTFNLTEEVSVYQGTLLAFLSFSVLLQGVPTPEKEIL